MVRIEAPACGESRRQRLLPSTCGYRASRRLYPFFVTRAPRRRYGGGLGMEGREGVVDTTSNRPH